MGCCLLVGSIGGDHVAGGREHLAAALPRPHAGLPHRQPLVDERCGRGRAGRCGWPTSTSVRCSASRWACEPPKRARIVRIGISSATTSSWRPSAWASTARQAGRPTSAVMRDVGGRRAGGDVRRQPVDRRLWASSVRPAPASAMTACRSLNTYHGSSVARVAHASASGVEAAAHVDAVEAQAPQQGAGVEHLERHAGGLVVVDVPVVDGERRRPCRPASSRYRARCHQLWTVNRLPSPQSAWRVRQEADALVDPALHLVDVGHGVGGPHVVAVAVHGGEPVVLGQRVVAALLEPERVHAPARSRGGGGLGRWPAASVRRGRAGWLRRRGRSRAGGRRAARAGRPASRRAARRAGGRRRASRPQAMLEGGAVGGLTVVERERAELGRELAGAVQVGRIGRRERQVGGQDETHGEVGFVVDQRASSRRGTRRGRRGGGRRLRRSVRSPPVEPETGLPWASVRVVSDGTVMSFRWR